MKYYNSKENSKNIICEINDNTTIVGTPGGEGTVYKIDEHTVAKILHDDIDNEIKALKEKKLIKMLKSAEFARSKNINITDHSAWPLNILYDESGNFAGYTMPFVASGKGSILKNDIEDSNLNWKIRVKLAANLSAVVHNVHQMGYVIGGDLKPENVIYYKDEKSGKYIIILIDCDSFQYKDDSVFYPCTAYEPNYVAPEMQKNAGQLNTEAKHEVKKTNNSKIRINYLNYYTTDSDYFTLAILIYQILSYGVNPFRAHYLGEGKNTDYNIPQNIQNGICPLFPKTCIDRVTGDKLPIEITVQFPLYPNEIFPDEIIYLFEKTFVNSYRYDRKGNRYIERNKRATAKEWYVALSNLLNKDELKQCLKNGMHYHHKNFECPLCKLNQNK